jgi:hypothetical protein
LAARRKARSALGRDPVGGDVYAAPPKAQSPLQEPPRCTTAPLHPSERSERVLTLGEAASHPGLTRAEMEAMIDAGKDRGAADRLRANDATQEVERLSTSGRAS